MKTMIICVTGMDGTGKTTLIKALCRLLKKKYKYKVYYTHLLSKTTFLHIFLKKLAKKGIPNFELKNTRTPYRTGFLRAYILTLIEIINSYLTYYLILRKFNLRVKVAILCDRYFYDRLAILACTTFKPRRLIAAVCKLLPKPDFILILTANPITAYIRKTEHPVSFYIRQYVFYKFISHILKSSTAGKSTLIEIDTSNTRMDEIVKSVAKFIFNELET